VAVRRAAGEQLDRAAALELAVAGEEIAAARLEAAPCSAVAAPPRGGRRGDAVPARGRLVAGGALAAGQVAREARLPARIAQLLEQHRAEVHGEQGAGARCGQALETLEQREVALGGRFVQPVLAVRPDA